MLKKQRSVAQLVTLLNPFITPKWWKVLNLQEMTIQDLLHIWCNEVVFMRNKLRKARPLCWAEMQSSYHNTQTWNATPNHRTNRTMPVAAAAVAEEDWWLPCHQTMINQQLRTSAVDWSWFGGKSWPSRQPDLAPKHRRWFCCQFLLLEGFIF